MGLNGDRLSPLPHFPLGALEKEAKPWPGSLPDECCVGSEDRGAASPLPYGRRAGRAGLWWAAAGAQGLEGSCRGCCHPGSSLGPARACAALPRSPVSRTGPLLGMAKSRKNESYVQSFHEVILSGKHWKHLHLQPQAVLRRPHRGRGKDSFIPHIF